MSEEQRKKLSDSCKGRSMDEETKQKISKAFKGRKLSEEHKKKIGESNKGKSRQTKEGLERLRKIQQERKGKPGKPHTEETKRKISEATKGRVPWNKGKKGLQKNPALAERNRNKVWTEEEKEKIKAGGRKNKG